MLSPQLFHEEKIRVRIKVKKYSSALQLVGRPTNALANLPQQACSRLCETTSTTDELNICLIEILWPLGLLKLRYQRRTPVAPE
jgi:hypothetical protein